MDEFSILSDHAPTFHGNIVEWLLTTIGAISFTCGLVVWALTPIEIVPVPAALIAVGFVMMSLGSVNAAKEKRSQLFRQPST